MGPEHFFVHEPTPSDITREEEVLPSVNPVSEISGNAPITEHDEPIGVNTSMEALSDNFPLADENTVVKVEISGNAPVTEHDEPIGVTSSMEALSDNFPLADENNVVRVTTFSDV